MNEFPPYGAFMLSCLVIRYANTLVKTISKVVGILIIR